MSYLNDLIDKACHKAEFDLPVVLQEINAYEVVDVDHQHCGPLGEDEKMIAAYLAGQDSAKE